MQPASGDWSGTLAQGPLAGRRVIELANLRGDLCGRLLADLGAEVITVEPPGGTPARTLGPLTGAADHQPGLSLLWLSSALGKKSVVLDLDQAEDQEALRALASPADVMIESFDPGVLDRRGLGYAELARLNPGLVYVSITPYGQSGPDASAPATDLSLQAAGGLVGLQGDADRPPVPVGGPPHAYYHAGAQAAADTVIALYERDRSGLGQHLDVSIQAAVIWTLAFVTGYPPNYGANAPGTSETRGKSPAVIPGVLPTMTWACKDGFVVVSVATAVVGPRTLNALARWMESEQALPGSRTGRDWTAWVADVHSGALTAAEALAMVADAERFIGGKSKVEVQRFAAATGALIAPIYDASDIVQDAHLAARRSFTEIDGRLHPGAFVRASGTPVGPVTGAPALGAHQHELRRLPPPTSSRPPAMAGPRPGAFAGLKVADFSWVGVGPMITKALGDHGATVVRVESTARPDPTRLTPPFKDGQPGINRSQFMAYLNTSKSSLALDLTSARGPEVARRLIDWADVVVESFTPGTMARWGLDYATVARGRDDLIMLSTCLRGQTGPEAGVTGFGMQGTALAGLQSVTGWPDRPPAAPWGAMTDFIAARLGSAALGAALVHRQRTGKGQYLDLAQVEAGIRFVEPGILEYTVNGQVAGRQGARSPYAAPSCLVACADGRHLALSVESTAHWRALVAALRLEQFAGDAYLELSGRRAAEDAIEEAVAAWCATREAFAAACYLRARGVPAAAVAWPSDLYRDPQLLHRGYFVTLQHSEMGPVPYDGPVTHFSATPARLRAAPCLGEHSDMVLRELLGYPASEIAELVVTGTIR